MPHSRNIVDWLRLDCKNKDHSWQNFTSIWVSSTKIPCTKHQTSQLESKTCKQPTPYALYYARPSPAVAGISGACSTSFGPLDCDSSQKQDRKPALPPTKRGRYNFSLNEIQLMPWTNQLNVVEHHTCIFIPVGITMWGSIVTVLVEISTLK